MIAKRNNHVFKGHKTLLGSKYVTYAEMELPTHSDIFSHSNNGFDWGYHGSSTIQLAFAILYQLSNNADFSKKHASKFSNEVIRTLNARDWVLNSHDVLDWINNNLDADDNKNIVQKLEKKPASKRNKKQNTKISNIVKETCQELGITQKALAEILEIPEGTVSSWAVKNEIPRLGKKAIEFYKRNKKNEEIVESFKHFTKLMQEV